MEVSKPLPTWSGVPSPLCAVRPPTLTRCHTGLLCGAGPGALAGHPCSCPQLLDWCCEGRSPLDGVGTALADLLGPAADKPLGVNSAAWKYAKWERRRDVGDGKDRQVWRRELQGAATCSQALTLPQFERKSYMGKTGELAQNQFARLI